MSATNTITTNPGIMPSTFMVAGIDMIPAPTMVVDMLNTAPEMDPFCRLGFGSFDGKRGARIGVVLVLDIGDGGMSPE